MKFKNNHKHDVYIDLGGLKRIAPGEVIELTHALKCEPLTPILEHIPAPKKKAPKPKPKKSTPKDTI
tara:strand:- start:219 stop:419 length:201 start_codon:yes stop_codon:yes gene_type:complete